MDVFGVPRDRLRRDRSLIPAFAVMAGSCVAFFTVLLGVGLRLEDIPHSVRLTVTLSLIGLLFLITGSGILGGVELGRRRLRERLREQARFKLTDDALIRHLPDEVDTVIRFDEIVWIVEGASWLTVGANTGWRISIPREVGRYDELRAALSAHAPIGKAQRSSSGWLYAIATTFLVIICILLMATSKDHSVRVGAGAVLTVAVAWQYIVFPLLSLRRRKRQPAA